MADKMIGELPQAPQVTDSTLIAVEQSGQAKHLTGAQWKEFAKAAVKVYADAAKESANQAAASAGEAKKSADAAKASAEDAADSAQEAKEYSGKPPIIQDGRWWTWDATLKKYIDTGEPARGNLMYATFALNPTDGYIYMYTDEEYTGPTFRLVDGYMEVVLRYGD